MTVSIEIAGTFFAPDAYMLNSSRLEHLDSLGLHLEGRSVYEPGCGIGLLTSFFEDKGCSVLSSDVQEANCKINLELHPWREGRVFQADTDAPVSHEGTFDIVFVYGLLYHVFDPGATLRHLSAVCNDLLLLSTCVYCKDDGELHSRTQWAGTDQGLRGNAFSPARNWVMTELAKHFPYVYVSRQQPNYNQFPTRWPTRPDYWKRAVFVASRNKLELPTLSTTLLMEQEAYHG